MFPSRFLLLLPCLSLLIVAATSASDDEINQAIEGDLEANRKMFCSLCASLCPFTITAQQQKEILADAQQPQPGQSSQSTHNAYLVLKSVLERLVRKPDIR